MRVVLVLALLALAACAAPVFEVVTASEAAALEGVAFLDVRTPAEFSADRIAGAINLDYYSPMFAQDLDALDKRTTYLVYCGSGKRSYNTTIIMRDLGFRRVYELEDGIRTWKEAGYPTVCDEPVTCPLAVE